MRDGAALAAQLQAIAAQVEAISAQQPDDQFTTHPDTQQVLDRRTEPRRQLNYSVPETLGLQRRLRYYAAATEQKPGDVMAVALDLYLRAKGYPPDFSKR